MRPGILVGPDLIAYLAASQRHGPQLSPSLIKFQYTVLLIIWRHLNPNAAREKKPSEPDAARIWIREPLAKLELSPKKRFLVSKSPFRVPFGTRT